MCTTEKINPETPETPANNSSQPLENSMEANHAAAINKAASSSLHLSNDEVRYIIAEYAYYKAQQRGFEPGYDFQDWITSEKDIINKLAFLGIDFTVSK